MKITNSITILIAVLLCVGAFMPVTSAERDSLKVFMTAEDRIYKPDDIILVELRVYDKGVLIDADEIEVTLDTQWQWPDLDIEMTWISTGVYQGDYTIEDDDHHAWFRASVVKDNDSDDTELEISIFQDEFELGIHFAHQRRAYAWPDDAVTATITARYRGDLVDVDGFSYIRIVDPYDEETELESTRVSQGTYDVTYTFINITENGDYELEAHATYAGAHAYANAYITINVLNVWYNLDSIAGNTATFTLGVADEDGSGVSDAGITITYPRELTGTTGEDGTAIFSLTGVWNGVHVSGYVITEDKLQKFGGYIFTEDPYETPNPSHHSFDIIYEGSEYMYGAGQSVTRSYKAYNCSVPMQDQKIHYYITLESMGFAIVDCHLMPVDGSYVDGAVQVIKTGTATTNQLGDFTISFYAPSAQGEAYIHFETGIPRHSDNYNQHYMPNYDLDDELVYEEVVDVVFISKGDLFSADSITIKSDPLVVGGKTRVTIETSQALGDGDELFAKWMPGIPTSGLYYDEYESDWVCWVEGGNIIFLEKNGGNEYVGRTVIPDFMPSDGDYTIVAGNIDGDTGQPGINQVSLKEGESASPDDSGMPMIPILLALIILVIVIAIAALAVRKKPGTVESLPPEEQLPPPDEPPAPSSEEFPPPPPDYPPPPEPEG